MMMALDRPHCGESDLLRQRRPSMILRGPLLGDRRWLGMIRVAHACSSVETFGPRKTEPIGEPDPLTPSLIDAGSDVTVF